MDPRRLVLLACLALLIGCSGGTPPSAPGGPIAQGTASSGRPVTPPAASSAPKVEPSSVPDDKKAPDTVETADPPDDRQTTQTQVRDIILKHAALFDPCYTIGAGDSQKFVATVTVKATVNPSGVVSAVKIVKSTAHNKKVDKCVAEAFKQIQFPPPKDTATSVITFPMEFSAVEEAPK